MTNNTDDKKKNTDKDNALKPDPETLNKTDPQDNMKGPLSSVVQSVKETVEENDTESKEEADDKKDKNT